MPPDDPLGRRGPTLEEFLRKPKKARQCPYLDKCTYGKKCKFSHDVQLPSTLKQPVSRMKKDPEIEFNKESLKRTLSSKDMLGKTSMSVHQTVKQTYSSPSDAAISRNVKSTKNVLKKESSGLNNHKKLSRQLTLNAFKDLKM